MLRLIWFVNRVEQMQIKVLDWALNSLAQLKVRLDWKQNRE